MMTKRTIDYGKKVQLMHQSGYILFGLVLIGLLEFTKLSTAFVLRDEIEISG